jgi:hypothetical protein
LQSNRVQPEHTSVAAVRGTNIGITFEISED